MRQDGPGAPALVVGCVKWGTRYGPDYVNVLFRAVRAHLDRPHRFVCVTDAPQGLDPGIDAVPFPEFDPPRMTWRQSCFPKIALLAPGVVADDAVVLQVDLDVMIAGDLAPFFDLFAARPAFYSLREWNPALVRTLVPLAWRPDRGTQGSIYLYRAGDQRYMFEHFTQNTAEVFARYKSDRFYFPKIARDPAYLPVEWCPSFKNACVFYWPFNRLLPNPRLPREARILVFHGDPRPIDLLGPPTKRWGTSRKFGFGAVPFVRDYWVGHGGAPPDAAAGLTADRSLDVRSSAGLAERVKPG